MQGAGALLGEAEMLLAKSLKRLMLGDLHARADIAVAMDEESEGAGQMLAAKQNKEKKTLTFRNVSQQICKTSVL